MGVPNAGLAAITAKLGTTFWIALGVGTTAYAAAQTTLASETAATGLSRAAATVMPTTTTVANDTLNSTKTFTSAATATISEVGLFDADAAGNMYQRSVLSPYRALVSGDTMTVTIKIVFSAA